jgi:hypothetical protein
MLALAGGATQRDHLLISAKQHPTSSITLLIAVLSSACTIACIVDSIDASLIDRLIITHLRITSI